MSNSPRSVPGFRDPDSSPGCGTACREYGRRDGASLREAFSAGATAKFVLCEGWTDIAESAGYYRSRAWRFPNQYIEIVRQTPPDLVLLDITMDDLDGWQTATLLRELRPASELPIVFVSANLFEHEASRLAAQQCQAFVGKPVIESELLQALEQALQLEWVRDNTPLAHAPRSAAGPVDPHDTLATLPGDLRENLARLARSGQAAALREQLRRARAELPNHQATLALLQACADRFDFEALAEHLRAVQAADA